MGMKDIKESGDEKYFDILKFGDGKNLPSVINIGLKK